MIVAVVLIGMACGLVAGHAITRLYDITQQEKQEQ
jgi:hypothetical protein